MLDSFTPMDDAKVVENKAKSLLCGFLSNICDNIAYAEGNTSYTHTTKSARVPSLDYLSETC